MSLPIFELTISEKLDDESEVSYISLVDAPAIQKNFLHFNQDISGKIKPILNMFQIVNEDERIVSGALMLADELIYRTPNKNIKTEHYVKFSADTIKQIAIKFAKRKYQNHVNLMHDPNQVVDGVVMFESWITDKKRGVLAMKGFEEVANGSWFGSFYVENTDVWNQIKDGTFKGFSVEGMFDYEEPISAEENALRTIDKLLKEIITN